MPTPDYSKSCIYMLRHKDDTELENIYIGSTTNFKVRKNHHKRTCCNPNNKNHHFKIYQYIRDNGGWEEWIMVWLEDYPCKTLRELQLREDQVMLQYQNRLNDRRAYRTHKKEWYEENKERLDEYVKQWYEDNKERLLEKAKQYREKNKNIINEKQKEKIKCNIGGCESTRNHLKRPQQTKKCQSHLTNS